MDGIELGDKHAIDALRNEHNHKLSSHAFTSLYLWREYMGLEMHMLGDGFAVRATRLGSDTWFFPCGSEACRRAFIDRRVRRPGLHLLYMRPEDAQWLTQHYPGMRKLARDESADEYIYERHEHIELAGGRYGHIRWRMNKIRRDYAVRVEPLSEANADDAKRIAQEWFKRNIGAQTGPLDDNAAVREALAHWKQLGMQGVIVYLDSRPAAFMMGFELAEDTFDASIGKCAMNVQGLTYFALRELFIATPERYKWFNLEEDLGLSGLRAMKAHFLPNGKNEIWEARRI